MLFRITTALVIATVMSTQAQDAPKLETLAQKASYAMGTDFGRMLQSQGVDIDPKLFMRGMSDMTEGHDLLLDEEELRQTLVAFEMEMREKRQAQMAEAGKDNVAKGLAFLEANKAKDGVKVTESGLQYEVLHQGTGPKPKATDQVTVHYVGTLIDGTEFDSSVARGQPASFALNQVIKGWTEGVQLMNQGSKFRFVIPSELAYGERGAGAQIGPNSTLVFEVELLEVPGEGADPHAGHDH